MNPSAESIQLSLNLAWILLAGILVFVMQAGFTLLEAGFTRAKHSISVAMKNVADIMVAILLFSTIGFPIMFGDTVNGWFGTTGFFFSGMNDDPRKWAYLFFQIVFAGTAATIVSGAIAERARLIAYLIGTAIVTVFVYPVVGHWAWGGGLNPNQQGWLAELGFMDFAGSSIVHSVGGWIAFAAAIVIGPRVGKYGEDGSIRRFTPSNLIFATLGTFLLWFGWFGFNAGSTLTAGPEIALITLNTALGGAAGGFAAMTASWVAERRPRAEDMLNGVLGGLVSVTAGCNVLPPLGAVLAGMLGGLIVFVSARFIDAVLKVDDAVGAISVHGVCGVWGTLAVGLFGNAEMLAAGSRWAQIGVQALGAVVVFLWAFGTGYLIYRLLGKTVRLRVTREDEMIGLNISEHGARTSLLDTVQAMHEIAAEHIDLTRKLDIEPGDDTEELNRSFNHLLDRIAQLVGQVKGQTGLVHSRSQLVMELSRRLDGNSALQDESVRHTYEYFRQAQSRMQAELEADRRTIAAFENALALMNEISAEMRAVRERMNAMASGIGVLEARLGEAGEAAHRLGGAMSDIAASSDESRTIIAEIGRISTQVGLLSINAGIEAARAGEFGAGFDVVAREIKNLAEQTKRAAGNIRELLERMEEAVAHGGRSTAHFGETFEYLSGELVRMSGEIRKAAGAVEAMYRNAQGFMAEAGQLRLSAAEMKEARERQYAELEALMDRLRRVLEQIGENRSFSSQISERIMELKGQSDSLDEMKKRFKTPDEVVH